MSISQDKKAVVMDKQGLEYICSCIKLLQSVPELLNDLTPSQKTVYSSYKVTELINALGENLQTYVNTSLGALNNLKKEIVQAVPSVDTAEENTIYLLKNDGDGGYSQYLLINGVVENLGSTTAINNVYTKTETDAKFALLSTLNDLIATVGGLNELKTDTKESIVKAINELNDRNYLEVIEITDKSVLDYAKTFDILTHTYFYANNCVDLPNNEHYGYCSVEVSQDPLYRDITFYSPTDGRIYVNTIGANAEGSDFGTWSGWHKHLTNNDIVDTINSSSTDNQIPSALAVYDKVGKYKIYHASDLGITNSTTLPEMVQLMPDYSILYVDWNPNLMAANSKWYAEDVSYGVLEIVRNTSGFIRLEHTFLRRKFFFEGNINDVTSNIMFLTKVCTTSVADVPLTKIKLNDGFTGTISYTVKNGICYVKVDAFKSEKTGENLIVSDTLFPSPSMGTVTAMINFDRAESETGMITIVPVMDNRLRMHCYKANTNGWCTFSYPVLES